MITYNTSNRQLSQLDAKIIFEHSPQFIIHTRSISEKFQYTVDQLSNQAVFLNLNFMCFNNKCQVMLPQQPHTASRRRMGDWR